MARGEKALQKITEIIVGQFHITVRNDPETREGFGYQVWKCTSKDSYRADGMYGQLCIILRSYNAVVTITAHNETEHKDILRAIWEDLLPKLESSVHDKDRNRKRGESALKPL